MRYAFDSIRRRPGRSGLTVLGIGLAVGLVIILLAVAAGVQSSAVRLAQASGVDLLAVSSNTSIGGAEFPYLPNAHALPGAMEKADPNAAAVSPWLIDSLTFGNASLYAAANASEHGVPPPSSWSPARTEAIGWIPGDNSGLNVPAVQAGPGFSSSSDLHYANGTYQGPFSHDLVIDQELGQLLNASVGSTIWASQASVGNASGLESWYGSATPFTVVGISSPFWLIPSEALGFLFLSELQQLVGLASPSTDYASVVLIHLTDPTRAATDQSLLERAFPTLTVFTLANVLGAVEQAVNLYRTFGTLIGVIGLVVAALFTTTVLLMSVDDRSQEIALRRALGSSRGRIGWLVAEEAILLSLLGLAVGVALGGIGSWALNRFLTRLIAGLPNGFTFVSFDLSVLATGLLIVLVIGLGAAILPAWRAMQFPIAEELRAP
ncbi:MAG: FtsX-like permease family protein [Thermoplasmata archaeon]